MGTTATVRYAHKRFYIGDQQSHYAQMVLDAAGNDGWQLVQIMQHDAWMKRAERVGDRTEGRPDKTPS